MSPLLTAKPALDLTFLLNLKPTDATTDKPTLVPTMKQPTLLRSCLGRYLAYVKSLGGSYLRIFFFGRSHLSPSGNTC
jgi:hypothetical protein